MIKTTAIIATLLTIFNYNVKCGKTSTPLSYEDRKEGDRIIMVQHFGEQVSTFTMDSQYRTLEFKIVSKKENTDASIVLKDGVYHLKGTVRGKAVDKTVKSKGDPWYQPIGYVLGRIIDGKKSVTYECFNPQDFEFHPMIVKVEGEEMYESQKAVKVRSNATGGLAKLWHCYYFYDPETLVQNGYRAVEGVPGTPETTWSVVK